MDEYHTNSVSSLYDSTPGIPDRVAGPYYGLGLKALALLDRASVKASSADTVSPEVWAAEHSVIQGALSRFADIIESPQEATSAHDGTMLSLVHSTSLVFSALELKSSHCIALCFVSVNVYAATCALHMPYIRQWAHIETQAGQRNHLRSICRDAASTAAAILRQLRDVQVAIVPVWQGVSPAFSIFFHPPLLFMHTHSTTLPHGTTLHFILFCCISS